MTATIPYRAFMGIPSFGKNGLDFKSKWVGLLFFRRSRQIRGGPLPLIRVRCVSKRRVYPARPGRVPFEETTAAQAKYKTSQNKPTQHERLPSDISAIEHKLFRRQYRPEQILQRFASRRFAIGGGLGE